MIFRLNKIPIHLIVAGSAWVSRVIISLIQLGSIRVLTIGLGIEQYAIFVLLSGLAGWFALLDFGLGVSLQNYISEQRAKEKPYDLYLNLTGLLVAVILVALIFIFYLLTPFLSEIFLQNFHSINSKEKEKLFFLTSAVLIGTTLGSLVYKVWYATQKGYLANFLPAIGAIIGYISLLYVNTIPNENRLVLSIIAFLGPSAVLSLVAFIFNTYIPIKKTGFIIDKVILFQLLRRGISFWFVSVLAAVVLQVDYIVISQKLNVHDIVVYNIAMKIFGLAFFIYSSLLLALWPVFSEKIAKKDWVTVKYFIVRYVSIGTGFMALSTAVFSFMMPDFITLLAPNQGIIIPGAFILLMGLYQIIRVWTDTFSTVLQSMGDLRPFWLTMPFQALLSVSIQWILASYFGIYGIIMGLIISFVLTTVWILPRATFKYINNEKNI